MTTRIYLIKSEQGEEMLIEAPNQSQALNHAVRGKFNVRVATGLEIAAIVSAGGKVQLARKGE